MSRPGALGIRTRRIAIMVAPGVKDEDVRAVYEGLLTDGAVPRLVGSRLGKVDTSEGNALDVEISLEAGPSALYDALVLMGGAESLEMDAHALEFVRDQYRHCKPILSIGSSAALLEKTGIPPTLPDGGEDHGLISSEDDSIAAALNNFKAELATHRVFDRETDPPRV